MALGDDAVTPVGYGGSKTAGGGERKMKLRTQLLTLVVCAVMLVSFSGVVNATSEVEPAGITLPTATFDKNVAVPIQAVTLDGAIKVAILATYTGSLVNEDDACVDMANTLINNGIYADVVRYYDIDTMSEILNYDVVILGTSGSSSSDNASGYGIVQDEIRSFAEDYGGGVIGVGGMVYTSSPNNYIDYDAIMPVDCLTPYAFLWGYNVEITYPTHPLANGVNNFGFGSANIAEWAPGGVKPAADIIGIYTQNSKEAIVSWTPGTGRSAYLGPYYLCDEDSYNTTALYQNPDTVQLLINSVIWTAGEVIGPSVSITTDRFEYSPGDTMIRHLEIDNPTADPMTFNWYLGVPQFAYWGTIASVSIPAGFSYSDDLPFPVGDWGSTPFGMVWYVELTDGTGEVLDSDAATCAYLLGVAVSRTSDAVGAIEKSIRKAGQ